jgi:hypothetical protein
VTASDQDSRAHGTSVGGRLSGSHPGAVPLGLAENYVIRSNSLVDRPILRAAPQPTEGDASWQENAGVCSFPGGGCRQPCWSSSWVSVGSAFSRCAPTRRSRRSPSASWIRRVRWSTPNAMSSGGRRCSSATGSWSTGRCSVTAPTSGRTTRPTISAARLTSSGAGTAGLGPTVPLAARSRTSAPIATTRGPALLS